MDQVAGQLFKIFPEERKGIIAFIRVLDEVISALDGLKPEELLEHGGNNVAREVLERWSGVSARELAGRYLKDQRLKDLLASQGTGDAEMSVVLLARMWRFMSKVGIWYTKGGIGEVPELLTEKVRTLGGNIRLGEGVERILVHDGAVVGVELAGGALIKSTVVISDADYKETFLKLLPSGTIPQMEIEKIAQMPLTPSAFIVFLGVKKELVDLSAFKGDHILVKITEGKSVPWEQKRPQPEDFLQDEIWLSWWSRHDPALAAPGCEALMIKLTAPFYAFAPFYGGGRGRHNERYYSIKEKMADALVEAASKVLPGLPGAVVFREVATPLTYKDLGHRSEGSVAGWSWKFGDYPEPWTKSLAVTPVRGLLMVGLQSFTRIFYGGVGTAMYSGKYAAEMVIDSKRQLFS